MIFKMQFLAAVLAPIPVSTSLTSTFKFLRHLVTGGEWNRLVENAILSPSLKSPRNLAPDTYSKMFASNFLLLQFSVWPGDPPPSYPIKSHSATSIRRWFFGEQPFERKLFPSREKKATLENTFEVSSDWKHSNTKPSTNGCSGMGWISGWGGVYSAVHG